MREGKTVTFAKLTALVQSPAEKLATAFMGRSSWAQTVRNERRSFLWGGACRFL